ncbi:MAG: efflux RND transporter periplasmic adaptor subunit [Lewinellaceae bacterium]|nr:efflux RND transporter periplasmic adaptor subunit [Lewinellaceae bacterium]
MKKVIIITIILAMLASTAYFAYGYFYRAAQPQIVAEAVRVKTGDITNEVSATGTVEPVEQVEVGTQVSGEVSRILVDYNSVVKKGQLIAELDKSNLKAALADAQASYNSALNELNYYKQNFERQENMYNAQVISRAEYEQAAYQLKNAEQAVTQRKSSLAQAQTNLSYANIYSPIDGVVLDKNVEQGQTVAASYSTPTLFTIARGLAKMQVEANVDEADIGGVKEGQHVSFTVDAYPDETFDGAVAQVRLGATVTSNVVTYTVIVEADNPGMKLKPGLTATIIIYTKELKGQKVIEAKAVNFTPDSLLLAQYYEQQGLPPGIVTPAGNGHKIWIKEPSGALSQKEVELGESDGINYQILSGLDVGDEVVFNLKEINQAEVSKVTGDSPFMPKPPGKK